MNERIFLNEEYVNYLARSLDATYRGIIPRRGTRYFLIYTRDVSGRRLQWDGSFR